MAGGFRVPSTPAPLHARDRLDRLQLSRKDQGSLIRANRYVLFDVPTGEDGALDVAAAFGERAGVGFTVQEGPTTGTGLQVSVNGGPPFAMRRGDELSDFDVQSIEVDNTSGTDAQFVVFGRAGPRGS